MAVMVLASLTAPPLTAKEKWVRVRSSELAHRSATDSAFEVVTTGGESAGRKVLVRLAELRSALAPGGVCPLPVQVLLLSGEREFAAFRPDPFVKGFYQSGPDRDTIITFDQGPGTMRVLAHEFVHMMRHHYARPLSRWLEEGIAEYYSPIEFHNSYAIAGQRIPAHESLLGGMLPPGEAAAEARRYAESWTVVRGTFAWLRGAPEVRLPRSGDPTPPPSESMSMDDEASTLFRAELLLLAGNRKAAAVAIRQAAERNPQSAGVQLGFGMLAMAGNRPAEARTAIARAIELGAGATATFEYAMLLRDAGEPAAEVDRWLGRTLELSPLHVEAHLISGLRATAAGDLSRALEHLRQAAEILPRQSSLWHALGYAQWKAEQKDAARESAKRAHQAAVGENERQMAESLLALVEGPVTAPRPRGGPAVFVPPSWTGRRGETRVEGRLEGLDCEAGVFQVQAGGRMLRLRASSETQVTAANGGSSGPVELTCPLREKKSVRVEYTGAGDVLRLIRIEILPD